MTETTHDAGPETALRLRFAALSDVGRHRQENQDSGYASERLLVVADGVGGAAYGDVASATAVQLLRRIATPPDGDAPDGGDDDDMLPLLAGAVHRVHDRLAEMVENDKELDGTSTTITAALFDGRRLAMAHVGDSRAYLLRDGELSQLTHDHTFVQSLVDEGRISEDEARVHPHRNIILKAVDAVHETDPDLFHVDLRAGDRVLLCSDGLTAGVEDPELGELLGSGTVDAASVQLVQHALDGGSTDNVTVVIAEVVPAGESDDPETTAAVATGPMLVGAAASQPRRGGNLLGRALFRARSHDTGELDPIPAEDGEEIDPEELRYAPRPPRRLAGLRGLLLVLVPLLLLAAVVFGAYQWTQSQYYVAADGDEVAIYQGVDLDLAGFSLSSVHTRSGVLVADLPNFDQQKVRDGIVTDGLGAAQDVVDTLEARVACDQAKDAVTEAVAARRDARERRQNAGGEAALEQAQQALRDARAAADAACEGL